MTWDLNLALFYDSNEQIGELFVAILEQRSTWQDVVRTFSEEDIEIPIYDIPVQQRVRARWTKSRRFLM